MKLPEGWTEYWDEDQQRHYYVENATKKASIDMTAAGLDNSGILFRLLGSIPCSVPGRQI